MKKNTSFIHLIRIFSSGKNNRKKFKELEPYNSKRQPEWLKHPEKSDENPEVVVDYRR